MTLGSMLMFLRMPHLRAQLQLGREMNSFYRIHFLCAAAESGLLGAVRSPASRNEIAQKLRVQRPELLESLLELGLSLGEVSLHEGRYRLGGQLSRALAADDGDPLVALIQECVAYHGSAFRHLPARLAGAPLGDYLPSTAGVVARSSRALEPLMQPFLRACIHPSQPLRLLEVGCGSGIYLRRAAEINPAITGIGIDLQEAVVEQAQANLAAWGLSDRFTIMLADIRRPTDELAGPFDLITLYNNIYYFPVAERPSLLRALRSRLAAHGSLAMVSIMHSRNVAASAFDVILRSTLGCAPLPELGVLTAQVKDSGFSHVQTMKLAPGVPFYGLLATTSAEC